MSFKIDKGIPMPVFWSAYKKTLTEMNIGDSVLCEPKQVSSFKNAGLRMEPVRKITSRKEGSKMRVWRVE